MPMTRVRIPSSASRFKDSHTGVVQMAGQRILTPPMQVRSLPPVHAAHSTVAQWKSTRLLTAGLRVRPPPVELPRARSVRRRRRSAKPSAAGSTPARASTSSGRSSAWKRARAWGARGRWFESSRPDLLAATRQSSGCSSAWPERTVRIREVAGSNPATQTCSTSSGMRLDRSTAVYRVNRVRFPVGALSQAAALEAVRTPNPARQGSTPWRPATSCGVGPGAPLGLISLGLRVRLPAPQLQAVVAQLVEALRSECSECGFESRSRHFQEAPATTSA